ncbi:MAG: transporter, phosphonate, periplasmic substrate-binding protein [Acidobacteria bacterium]|nr:transporter, phosphonate, periplasmic substrate-binding protein [Acidobacteriota bacterium]
MTYRLPNLAAFVLALLVPTAAFAQRTLVVYLPDAATESSKKLAESVTGLQQAVSAQSGVPFELKFFRKADDCASYLAANRAGVAVVVAPREFVEEAAPGLTPLLTFSRNGRESYRRILVVRTADAAKSLADLRGRTVSAILPVGQVLRPETGVRIVAVPDDMAAVAGVLYGGTDAALVSELNPLAAAHIGKELRVVHTSPPLPLPVVAIRAAAFTERERDAVEQAFLAAGRSLEALQISGFERIAPATKPAEEKRIEIVAIPAEALDLPLLNTTRLGATALLTVEIPDVPLPDLR